MLRNIAIKILKWVINHTPEYKDGPLEEVLEEPKPVIFASPISEEDIYKESDDIDTFIKKIQIKMNMNY